MSECSHDCSSCGQKDCGSREIPKEQLNEFSRVKKVIGIVSGKGGVGKSLVTSMMASATNKRGFNTAVLDADITGPSIPRMFGIKEHALGDGKNHIFPCKSSNGVDIMSINLLLESDTDPVVWRGPVIAGVVKQFWTEVVWKDIDYMYVDMPPGTGDVPLTVFQSLPVDGIIVVTSPQSLVSMVCSAPQAQRPPYFSLSIRMFRSPSSRQVPGGDPVFSWEIDIFQNHGIMVS